MGTRWKFKNPGCVSLRFINTSRLKKTALKSIDILVLKNCLNNNDNNNKMSQQVCSYLFPVGGHDSTCPQKMTQYPSHNGK